MKPKAKSLLQGIALMSASLAFCFLALEITLRLAGYGNVEIYEPDPTLYWKLKPNQVCVTKIDRKPVRINSHGTRGPEFNPAKPAQTLRILSLGDSKTFGWGLTESETYSGRLQELLQSHFGNQRRVEVVNAGVNAYSYPQMHAYFREYGLRFQPDLVLVADANLWTQFSGDNSPEFVEAFMRRVQLKNFLRRFATYHYIVEYQLKEVYERTRSRFIPVDPKSDALFKEQQKSDPDAFFRRHIEDLCRLAVSNRVQPVLIYIPALDDLLATNAVTAHSTNATNTTSQLARALRAKQQVHQDLKVPLIDLSPQLRAGNKALYLDADPVHLNAAGNAIIAQTLFQSITNLLQP
jgi:lysophospholipase L1-like esterase